MVLSVVKVIKLFKISFKNYLICVIQREMNTINYTLKCTGCIWGGRIQAQSINALHKFYSQNTSADVMIRLSVNMSVQSVSSYRNLPEFIAEHCSWKFAGKDKDCYSSMPSRPSEPPPSNPQSNSLHPSPIRSPCVQAAAQVHWALPVQLRLKCSYLICVTSSSLMPSLCQWCGLWSGKKKLRNVPHILTLEAVDLSLAHFSYLCVGGKKFSW